MREYILLPRPTFERLSGHKSVTPNYTGSDITQGESAPVSKPAHKRKQFLTTIPPRPLKLKVSQHRVNHSSTRPDLSSIIPLHVSRDNENYIRALLSKFEKVPQVTWDSQGNITSPVQSINIIKLLRTLINKNGKFTLKEIPDIQLLLQLANVSPEHIKNAIARKQIYGGGRKSIQSWVAY